jgi:hypothetical protein
VYLIEENFQYGEPAMEWTTCKYELKHLRRVETVSFAHAIQDVPEKFGLGLKVTSIEFKSFVTIM